MYKPNFTVYDMVRKSIFQSLWIIFTLSGAPSTTSDLDVYLSQFKYLGSPLRYNIVCRIMTSRRSYIFKGYT